jgi:hypothetical protein
MAPREDPERDWLLLGLGGGALVLVTVLAGAALWLGTCLWWAFAE